MNSCRECTVQKNCPWWCPNCLIHHPVQSMVKDCFRKFDASQQTA